MNNFERHFGSIDDAADTIVRMLTAESAMPLCECCPCRGNVCDSVEDGDCEDMIAAWMMQEVEE